MKAMDERKSEEINAMKCLLSLFLANGNYHAVLSSKSNSDNRIEEND